MKLEIDISSILYNDAKENRNYISLNKLEIAWKAIADGKPLEQEPTTKNNLGVDCISRTRAIERLKLNFPISQGADNSRDRHRYMQTMADIQAIREIPSVTPQLKKGHWKLAQRGKLIDVCCSNCEAVRIKGYAYNYTIDELNKEDINECFGSAEMRFCPNCGADMRGKEV